MTISNFSSKATGLIVSKFHVEPPGTEGTKLCPNHPGHMTNMPTTPIYGKTFKILQHQNQLTDGFETEYVALGA